MAQVKLPEHGTQDEAALRLQMSKLFERYSIPCDEVLLDKIFLEGFSYYDEFADLDAGALKMSLGLNLRLANMICKTAIREKQHMHPVLQRIGELDPLDHRLVPIIRDNITIQKVVDIVHTLTDLRTVKLYEHRNGSYVKLGDQEEHRLLYLVHHQRVIYFWDSGDPHSATTIRLDSNFGDMANPAPYSDAFDALQRMTGEKLTKSHRRHLDGFEYASLRQMLRKNELDLKDCKELVARLNQTIKTYTAQSLWSSSRMILLDRISHRNSGVSLHCVLYPEKYDVVVKVAKTGPEHIIRREWDTCQDIHTKVTSPSLVRFQAITQGRVNRDEESEAKFIIVMPYYSPLSQVERMRIDFGTLFEITVLKIMASVLAAAWGCAMAKYYHGDIKPANIVLPTNEASQTAAVLIDLGSTTPLGQSLARRTPEWGLGVAYGVEYDKACIASSTLALMYPHWQPDDLPDISPSEAILYVKRVVPPTSILHDFLLSVLHNDSYAATWAILQRSPELEVLLDYIKPVQASNRLSDEDLEQSL